MVLVIFGRHLALCLNVSPWDLIEIFIPPDQLHLIRNLTEVQKHTEYTEVIQKYYTGQDVAPSLSLSFILGDD